VNHRRIRRRWIPLLIAIVDLAIWGAILYWSDISEDRADRWTLLNLCLGYVVKSFMFWYMRQRMVGDRRRLTFFGWSLADFFAALTVLAVILAIVTAVTYLAVLGGHQPAFSLRLFNRLAINFGVWLVNGTGLAVLYEMRREDSSLNVHEQE